MRHSGGDVRPGSFFIEDDILFAKSPRRSYSAALFLYKYKNVGNVKQYTKTFHRFYITQVLDFTKG